MAHSEAGRDKRSRHRHRAFGRGSEMSELGERIEPFTALMFNRSRCGALAEVVAPPYDLIDKARQDALYARSPYNIVRLELNRDADPYASAAETLGRWLREGIVERAARPASYFYTT